MPDRRVAGTPERVLAESVWIPRAQAHRVRIDTWTAPRLSRRRAGQRHPVDDFLWDYYRLRPAQLAVWHPGVSFVLAGSPDVASRSPYRRVAQGWTALPGASDLPRLVRNLAILKATAGREVRLGCFGMHEWAMVHGQTQEQVRHKQVPLRLAPATVERVVAEVGLRCTHFDAFRFFTPSAAALQRPLTRAGQVADEQPGCVHAGMDLYRYAYESIAFTGSDLVADCFDHARAARQLDMQASPYDLTDWGLTAIPLETVAGRRRYADLQRELADRAAPLRARLITALELTVASATNGDRDPAQSA